jgi:hypothetical protein
MTENAILSPKPKRTLLPLLTVLFLVSYGLLTMLVVEQNRIIQTQRTLIGQLFGDSVELSSIKGKAGQKHNAEAKAQAQAKARSQAEAPSSQVKPHDNGKSDRNAGKVRRPAPQKPPRDTSETADERRTLISI